MTIENSKGPTRFPRLDVTGVLRGIPKLDLSKIKDNHPLIEDFVIEGGTHVGYGSFGTRKTTVHLLAGWAVARCALFLGRKTEHRMVLYLDYENPAGVLKTYCTDLGIDPSHPFFTIWDRAKAPPPLPGDPLLQDFVDRCLLATGVAPWIIFDSWTSLLREGDSGNEIGHATPIFRAIRALCDKGATVTIIDHTGHSSGKRPIGTSAKMTQMDASHLFEVKSDTCSLDGKASRTVIRVQNFLKRYAPKDVGTFSIEVKATRDEQGVWHTVSVEPTTDIAVLILERQIEKMKQLIRSNPSAGHEELAELAKEKKILNSRNAARRLLQEGIGKHWKPIKRGGRKVTYKAEK